MADTAAKMVHHPFRVLQEGRPLFSRRWAPENGKQAVVGRVRARRSRKDRIREPPDLPGVHRVAVEQLQLYPATIVYKRVDIIVYVLADRINAAFLFHPIPTRLIRAVFVLANADPAKTRIEQTGPPVSFPRQI